MAYTKQQWGYYDDTKTEEQNIQEGNVYTPERMNHIETGIKQLELDTEESFEETNQKLIDQNKEILTLIEEQRKQAIPDNLLSKVENEIKQPDGWTWTSAPIKIYKDGSGTISTNFEASDYRPTGKTYYVDINNGDNSNDGLTPAKALQWISEARRKEDVAVIVVASGVYEFGEGFNGATAANKNIAIVAASGANVVVTVSMQLTWAKLSGYSNVYNTSRTYVGTVFDKKTLTSEGDYTGYVKRNSIAEVDSTPGSYYYSGSNLYVHALKSAVVTNDNVIVFLTRPALSNKGNFKTYLEGIKIYGGHTGSVEVGTTISSDKPLLVAKNCEFKYATEGNGGVSSTGADVYLQNCKTALNFRDGNNYHVGNGVIPNAIEVGCTSYKNGIGRGTNEDNASTMHDGGSIIRVNGDYSKSEGPNVHDINSGTQSWIIGSVSHESTAGGLTRQSNYRADQEAVMWLDTSVGYGSTYSVFVGLGSEMYIRNVLFNDEATQIINGELIEY